MFGLNAIVTQKPDLEKKAKQMKFGIAVGLTRAAKEAQKASQDAIQSTFTVRGRWFEQQNKFGIKITPAKPTNLEAEVKTKADWLELHETGGTKSGKGHRLGVPLAAIRPKGSTKKIGKGIRPHALLASGKAFIVKLDNGNEAIARLRGKGANARLEYLYFLEPSVSIKKASTFYEPIQKSVDENLEKHISEGIAHAWATAK